MLIDTGSIIMEIRPQQIIELSAPITYPNLMWLNPPLIKKKVGRKVKKEILKDLDYGGNRQTSST
jgi:hypothetical protein